MPPDTFLVLVPIAGMATGAFFMFGVYKIVTRWMELRHRGELSAGGHERDELRRQVGELGDLQGRVAELEERLDFAERLLASHREPGQLPPRRG